MAQDEKTVSDISTLLDYYDTSRNPGPKPEVGQIVFTPVLNTDRKHMIADAQRSDPNSHTRADLIIRAIDDSSDFRGKPERLPIYAMCLGQTEELVITRAKKRPCVVLAKSDGVKHMTLPVGQQGKALNAFDEIYWLAPIYSVSTGSKARAFGPVMTARVKCMMYMEFVYVPQSGLIIRNPSVIRLDRMFWSHLLGASEPQSLFLTPEILGICWNQIRILSGDTPEEDYVSMRELLLMDLPEECK